MVDRSRRKGSPFYAVGLIKPYDTIDGDCYDDGDKYACVDMARRLSSRAAMSRYAMKNRNATHRIGTEMLLRRCSN